jgi:hypothetical protein
MFNRADRTLAAVLVAACILAVFVYVFARDEGPPPKVWFDAQGGDLIFDHAFHASMVDCKDCHHNLPDDPARRDEAEMDCRSCHYYDPDVVESVQTADPHPRAIGASCTDCHDHLGEELAACDACHLHLGYAFIASARYKDPFPDYVVFPEDDPVATETPGAVVFNHDYHKEIGQCLRCHHEYDPEATGVRPGEKSCRRCHHDDDVVDAEGEMVHEFIIGDSCLSCHMELGPAMSDCDACHLEPGADVEAFKTSLPYPPDQVTYETDMGEVVFDHQLHHYDHADIACTECHHEPSEMEGFGDLARTKDCAACHEERADRIGELADDGVHGSYLGNSCTSCHPVDDCSLCHRD